MADKNNIADENYLDNLLKAITGESEEDTSDDKINEDELDFESDVKSSGSEEDFLSDFEKEFFDEDESKLLDDMFGEVKNEKQEVKEVSQEPAVPFDENMFEGIELEDVLGSEDKAEEVNETINNAVGANDGDTSVEEDLQNLYGMLGVDNAEGKGQEKPKKEKKGFFGRNKKEKEPKAEKQSKKESRKEKKSKKTEVQQIDDEFFGQTYNEPATEMLEEPVQSIDPALEGFDVEALFNSSGAFGGEGGELDLSEGFSLGDSDSISLGGDAGGFDFGLDDSGFGATEENENDMLIRQMEEGKLDDDELLNDEEDSKSKKDKKKKEKKEKKEKKPKKEKAAKKDKAKKPKKVKEPKEKKPKEPDEIIRIPVIAVVFMLSFIVVAVVAAKMGGDYYFYQERIYDAVALYVDTDQTDIDAYEGRYSDAYALLSGMEMRNKEHQAFYDQVQTIMFMDRHYEAYKGYMLLENFDNGLDSLIKAVKMYDKYQNEARKLGCFDDMTVILSWVNDKLNNVYGITESRARELYMITDDREYAYVVRNIAGEAEQKYLESKTEEELK